VIAITVPPECRPSRVAIERIRGSAKNGPPRRLRCKGKASAPKRTADSGSAGPLMTQPVGKIAK